MIRKIVISFMSCVLLLNSCLIAGALESIEEGSSIEVTTEYGEYSITVVDAHVVDWESFVREGMKYVSVQCEVENIDYQNDLTCYSIAKTGVQLLDEEGFSSEFADISGRSIYDGEYEVGASIPLSAKKRVSLPFYVTEDCGKVTVVIDNEYSEDFLLEDTNEALLSLSAPELAVEDFLSLMGDSPLEDIEEEPGSDNEEYKELFLAFWNDGDAVQYEFLNTVMKEDTSTVKVNFTFNDHTDAMSNAIGDFMSTYRESEMLGGNMSDENMLSYFVDSVNKAVANEEIVVTTKTVDFPCIQTDGQWEIDLSNDLENDLTDVYTGNAFKVFMSLTDDDEIDTDSDVNRDRITRVKLDTGISFNDECIIDELGWFEDVSSTGEGLKTFYDMTGVQPFVYFKEYDESLTTDEEKEKYAEAWYDQNIDNESTFLYIYFAEEDTNNDIGYMYCVDGYDIESVMDSEAIGIFWDYVNEYWYDGDLSTDEFLIDAFDSTAEAIMHNEVEY